MRVLDLDPRAGAPARLVAGVEPLGDDPLEPLRARRLEQARAVARMGGGDSPRRSRTARAPRGSLAAPVGQLHQRVAVEVEQVEDRVDDRRARREPPHGGGEVTCMRRWRRPKLGRPSSSNATISPSNTASCIPTSPISPRTSGIGVGDLAQVAALQPQPARLDVGDRPNAVPLDLERPLALVPREIARAGPASAGPARASAPGPGPTADPSGGSSSRSPSAAACEIGNSP